MTSRRTVPAQNRVARSRRIRLLRRNGDQIRNQRRKLGLGVWISHLNSKVGENVTFGTVANQPPPSCGKSFPMTLGMSHSNFRSQLAVFPELEPCILRVQHVTSRASSPAPHQAPQLGLRCWGMFFKVVEHVPRGPSPWVSLV